jgi:hypothetical protein
MAQRGQYGRFSPDTIAVGLVDGNLQDEFFFFSVAAHQQCIRGAATTELADNDEPAVERIVPLRDAGIDRRR